MTDFSNSFSDMRPGLGFGGVVGFVVGYTAKKISKVAAFIFGGLIILMVGLQAVGWVTIDWGAVERSTKPLLGDPAGPALAERAWTVLVANIPFGGGLAGGFAIGFKLG